MDKKFGLQEVFFFVILIGLSIAFFNIISPFILDIFLTLILVILFQKPHRFFSRKLKNRKKTAAFLTITLAVFVIVIPLFLIGYMVTEEAGHNFTTLSESWPEIKKEITKENLKKQVESVPFLHDYVEEIDIEDYKKRIEELAASASGYAVGLIQSTFESLVYMLLHAFVVLFLLYYMLVDGKSLLDRLQYLIPLSDKDENEFLTGIKRVTDTIVINSFMLGAIEGVWGGLLLYFFDVPSPVFWGFLMAMFSVIPMLGANTAMFPIALVHLIIGDYTTGIALIILGNGVFLTNQNIIRPRLDGNRSGMHPAIVFLSSLGGLIWMGVVGFLAGPLLTALFITIWNQFGKRYQKKLVKLNKGDDSES